MAALLVALQFLTVFPVRITRFKEELLSESLLYYPLVGSILAIILMAGNKFLNYLHIDDLLSSVLLVVSLAVFTRGLHLDGLSDTADGLMGGKTKEERLKIMRDPHAGAMGIASIIIVLLLKISSLNALTWHHRLNALLFMCVLSRWAMVFVIFLFPYARNEGKAKSFFSTKAIHLLLPSTIYTLVCVLFFGRYTGLLLMMVSGLSAYLIAKAISRGIGGLTGDSLGAISELTETIVLLTMCFSLSLQT